MARCRAMQTEKNQIKEVKAIGLGYQELLIFVVILLVFIGAVVLTRKETRLKPNYPAKGFPYRIMALTGCGFLLDLSIYYPPGGPWKNAGLSLLFFFLARALCFIGVQSYVKAKGYSSGRRAVWTAGALLIPILAVPGMFLQVVSDWVRSRRRQSKKGP